MGEHPDLLGVEMDVPEFVGHASIIVMHRSYAILLCIGRDSPSRLVAPSPNHWSALTAFATTSAAVTSEMSDWSSITNFTHRDSGIVSVGLNAVEFVNDR